jgi:hypothetical protein
MDAAQRRRLIADLTRLPRSEFEAVVAEVRSRPNTEELAVAAFQAAFTSRAAADAGLGPLFVEPKPTQED